MTADHLSQDSVAIVTGGNRGIGLEVARQLADRGFDVVLGSRDLERGRRAAPALGSSAGRVLPCQLDVADPASVAAAASWISDALRRADILANNPGLAHDTH